MADNSKEQNNRPFYASPEFMHRLKEVAKAVFSYENKNNEPSKPQEKQEG